MADPYNPYSSYSTPTPGGVGYYPPDGQPQYPTYSHQHPYGTAETYGNKDSYHNSVPESYQTITDPNHVYAPQPGLYSLTPEPYGSALEKSYTPTGQPDYQGPATPTGYENIQARVPENAGY